MKIVKTQNRPLYDDDGLLPKFPDGGSLLYWAYGDAFILPVYADLYNPNKEVPFVMNLSSLGAIYSIPVNRDLYSAPGFWAVLVVGCFQPSNSEDGDGDAHHPAANGSHADDAMTCGITPTYLGVQLNQCAIFLETIYDEVRQGGSSAITDENHTVAHEIAHSAGQGPFGTGHAPGGILSDGAPRTENRFDPPTIRALRM